MINGPTRAAGRWEHREQLLQFVCVKPQTVAARTAVEAQLAGHSDFFQRRVATRAQMFPPRRYSPREMKRPGQRIVSGDLVEFAGVEPHAPATLTVIDLDRLELDDEQT